MAERVGIFPIGRDVSLDIEIPSLRIAL